MAGTTLADERLGELHQALKDLVDAVAFVGALTFSVAREAREAREARVTLPYGIEAINDQIDDIRAGLRSAFQDLPED